jgi:type III restriction enzyme
MALHPDFPGSPHAILDPEIRWFPADEACCQILSCIARV